MDRGGAQIRFAFPKPALGVKLVLAVVGVFAIVNASLITWASPEADLSQYLVVRTDRPVWQLVWRLAAAGFVTAPVIRHVLTALMGLYFLSPDLEKAWGTARYLAFLVASSALGFGVGLLLDLLPFASPHFHQPVLFGPYVMIAATSVAWARMRPDGQIFFFFFPVSTRLFLLITVALAALVPLFPDAPFEGAFGPLAGVGAGFLFSGSPSPIRRLWLLLRLSFYRRQSRALLDQSLGPERAALKRRPGAPPLRVVPGGLEDELKKRKPPKDKRYLN
jgi:hypothetical protein